MAERSGADRRRVRRYPTRHRVEGTALEGRVGFRGILSDLSVGGCRLHLDRGILPGAAIEALYDIAGLGLRFLGQMVWAEPGPGGVVHGVRFTGFGSEADALFHSLYVGRLARQAPASPQAG